MAELVEVELIVGAGGDKVVVAVPHVGVHITHPGSQQVLSLPNFLVIRADWEAESEVFGHKGSCAVQLFPHQLRYPQILLVIVVRPRIARSLRCVQVYCFRHSHVVFLSSYRNIDIATPQYLQIPSFTINLESCM